MKQNNTLALILATVGGGATEYILTNTWLTALCIAAASAAVGWFTTQFLNWCKRQIFKPKIKIDEN